ncbi:MAG: polysaccharide biosynthesis protein [Armatimonadetes bacterium]|nr:polysaccharide biosynthesis protein [Armatimonadota bacterium]MDE2207786.1 polysaccharide biosynthesis protein [Armatimonadota bacterium]
MDIVVLLLSPAIALGIRLEGHKSFNGLWSALAIYTVVGLVIRLVVQRVYRMYNKFWPKASVLALVQAAQAGAVSMVAIYVIYGAYSLLTPERTHVPRSVPFIDCLFASLVMIGLRLSTRLADTILRQPQVEGGHNVLIVGAGSAGQLVATEMRRNPQLGMRPVGFIDDDPRKQRLEIENLPVLGGADAFRQCIIDKSAAEVIVAMPKASGAAVRRFVTICEEAGVPVRTLPGMYEILGGKVTLSKLRPVDIEDLLRRDPIVTDTEAVRQFLSGKCVMITGGGGSIGSELCRQILQAGPRCLVMLGHGENSVFEAQNELVKMAAAMYPQRDDRPEIVAVIADIRMERRIAQVMAEFRPDVVFHAAAHKHVPLMENNPSEAITNNVFGTRNLLRAAEENDVGHLVMISSDKAVKPSSIMGASKRAAEMLVLNTARRTGKHYVAVRFGNVLGSRGSVVPIFKRQIAAGGPVTISHEDMTRFFMTIPEAVQLVLQAAVLGNGAEVMMLDMGEPIRIVDLAEDLIRLSGFEPRVQIPIVCTGVRPGEKLREDLWIEGERYESTGHEKIRIVRNATDFIPDNMDAPLQEFEAAVLMGGRQPILDCLKKLIPEFVSDEDRAEQHIATDVRRSAIRANVRVAPGGRSGDDDERIGDGAGIPPS